MSLLMSLPEELLERILCLSIQSPHYSRPDWHPPAGGRTAPLLVSKLFLRVATPTLYSDVHLRSSTQAEHFTSALLQAPSLAGQIRKLTVTAPFPALGAVLPMLQDSLLELDLSLSSTEDDQAFCQGLNALENVRVLKIRKPPHVYLTMPSPRSTLGMLAKAVDNWNELESVHILFRMSDDSARRSPYPFHSFDSQQPSSEVGPITALTMALSKRPRLQAFTTQLPSLWNPTVLTVSKNPSLERICLSPENDQAIVGTGMFLMEAWKHSRLAELIRTGTPIIRTRAQTLSNWSPSNSRPSTPDKLGSA